MPMPMALLLLLTVAMSEGTITSYLLQSIPIFDASGEPIRRVPKGEMPARAPIVATNSSGQLGIKLADGSLVYVRRSDVSYTGAPPDACRVVSVSGNTGSKTLSAGNTGATKGAGEGKRSCVSD